MSHFQNGRKTEGVVKSAAASFMILPQKCRPVLANIYRAALSAICQLTYSSVKAFHPQTDTRRSTLQREERRDVGGQGGMRGEEGGHKQLNGAVTENKGCGCRVHIFETLNCSFEAGHFFDRVKQY